MPRPLLFAAFVMNTASHILHGVWRRPDARQIEFNSLELWVNRRRNWRFDFQKPKSLHSLHEFSDNSLTKRRMSYGTHHSV